MTTMTYVQKEKSYFAIINEMRCFINNQYIVWNMDTNEELGIWDPETKTINPKGIINPMEPSLQDEEDAIKQEKIKRKEQEKEPVDIVLPDEVKITPIMEAKVINYIRVRRITIDEIVYYMSETNVLYDSETNDEIGIWDAITSTIIYTDDDEEE